MFSVFCLCVITLNLQSVCVCDVNTIPHCLGVGNYVENMWMPIYVTCVLWTAWAFYMFCENVLLDFCDTDTRICWTKTIKLHAAICYQHSLLQCLKTYTQQLLKTAIINFVFQTITSPEQGD